MSEPKQRWVENSIMRLAMSSTETTLGKNGYYAVVHVAGLDRLLDALPPDNTQLETPARTSLRCSTRFQHVRRSLHA